MSTANEMMLPSPHKLGEVEKLKEGKTRFRVAGASVPVPGTAAHTVWWAQAQVLKANSSSDGLSIQTGANYLPSLVLGFSFTKQR